MILSTMQQNIFSVALGLDSIAPNTGFGSGFTSIGDLVSNALGILLPLLLILLVGLIIYGGYTYMMSAGDQGKVKNAQAILTNAIIGFLIVAFAFVIRSLVERTITGT